MIATLCMLSSQARWLLSDAQAREVFASRAFFDQDQTGLSSRIANEFEALCESLNASAGVVPVRASATAELSVSERMGRLSAIAVVTGPGAFTGLRMSAAFAQGLALARNIGLIGIPTFDLVGAEFYFPLRHAKAAHMTLAEYLSAGFEFMKVSSRVDCEIAAPPAGASLNAGASLGASQPGAHFGAQPPLVFGLKNSPELASNENILRGLRAQVAKPSPFKLFYGVEPKIFGKRA